MAFPYRSIDGTSCLEFQENIRAEVSNDDCEVTANGRMVPSSSSMEVATICGCQCSICKDGSEVNFPHRSLLLEGEMITCSALASNLGQFLPSECKRFYEEIPINVASFCGCPEESAPERCSLCNDFFLSNSDLSIPDVDGLTCGKIAEIAPHVVDDIYCMSDIEILRGDCCSVEYHSPPESTTEDDAISFDLPQYVLQSSGISHHDVTLLVWILVPVFAIWTVL